ncbi:hypothetical protein [Marinobacter nauticus]|uniref:Uncharacterized protein n=1 Tax=Marinobacter nauticus TaxID=2743 RepID=A0A833JSQ0_MARNT|nr:hypothetical protein [Marinobacter nauticus]KAE8545340.1 hypothetical protein F6453_2312 [Marinobacter nauticus]
MATTIDFPKMLPTPHRSGYGLKSGPTFARTEMASGRAKQRPLNKVVPTVVPVTFLLTQEQAQIFEGWFNYEIAYGTAWFNCKLDSPMGLRPYECRFAEMYEGPERLGVRHWRYKAQFEIVERPVISEAWYRDGLQFVAYSSIIDLAINQEWPR